MRALALGFAAVVVAAGVVTLALTGVGGDGARPSDLRIGLVANTLDAGRDRQRQHEAVRAAGARWIREEFRWGAVEPRPGRLRWGALDRLMADATRNEIRVLPLLIGTPAWAGPTPLSMPDDPAAFGRFAGAVAARYGPRGRFWRENPRLDGTLAPRWFEVWNEPYLEAFAEGGVDPARYARMVAAAARAGRAANPASRWLMAVDLVYEGPDGRELPWLDMLYADDPRLHESFDGVAVHPYSFFGVEASDDVPVQFRFDRIEAIRDRLTELGAPGTPMWITELGWSTCALRPDCVSEETQAQRIRDVFRQLGGRYDELVDALFLYRLQDLGLDPSDREQHYGLLRHDGTPKPAWGAVASLTG